MSYTSLLCHIVFSTKERRPLLLPESLPRIQEYVGGILRKLGGKLLAAGGAADHLHLAASLHPSHAVADVVRTVKSNSSKWIRETLPQLGDFSWQSGYAAFSVSKSVLPQIERYLASQQEHHATRGFVDELKLLLTKHGIEFDEAHLM